MITLSTKRLIAKVARFFGQDPALIGAVVQAEGNIIKAVQCSIPSVKDEEKAIEVTCRSATHAMRDFIRAQGLEGAFVHFWADRWAPEGASNDPTGLNLNWPRNVLAFWTKG